MGVEDYFMRQINQLGKVLGKIIAELLKLNNPAIAGETIELINEQLITALKIDIDSIIKIPLNRFIITFEKDYEANFSNFEDLAEMLYQVAHLYAGQNENNKAHELFLRAKLLYNFLLSESKTFSLQYNQRIEDIETTINN
ncbi:MAG: hypothetical protein P1P88_07650 [Bacteroidales bacterium]|nr:hypothetical protein [Bacteroidales bacterium]